MIRRTRTVCAFAWSLACLTGLGVAPARAQTAVDIPPSAAVGPPQTAPGTGLGGEFYFAGHPTGSFATNANIVPTLAAAQTFISSNQPNSRFQAQAFNYTGTDSSLPAAFLGTDGATLAPPYTNPMYSSIYRLRGFINVTTAQTLPGQSGIAIEFLTNSDDGSSLAIGGTTVVNNDGQHGAQDATGIARFTAPGLYPIQVLYFNDEYNNDTGGANVVVRSSIGTNDPSNLTILPFTSTYQTAPVPEPGALLLCGLGVVGAAAARRLRGAAGRRDGHSSAAVC
jgi:PEP-CTERM motif